MKHNTTGTTSYLKAIISRLLQRGAFQANLEIQGPIGGRHSCGSYWNGSRVTRVPALLEQ